MSHIPFTFCGCGAEMKCEKMGITLEAMAKIGSYYKIAADVWKCPRCDTRVFRPAQNAMIFHFQPGYEKVKPDCQVFFTEAAEQFRDHDAVLDLITTRVLSNA